ncbi:MAG: hypothetical protein E7446_05415 [Ruminococcaceae bacterium]|nr:hypothetical protein [Oscillospiraceae bacterium]
MKRKLLPMLLAMVLLLSGCGSFLHREYSVVEPHSSSYYEDTNRGVLRAENYQDVINDLLVLIGKQEKEGVIWLYGEAEGLNTDEIAEAACHEVQSETPLGSYAVEYLTYTIDATPRHYDAITVTIGYRRTPEQMNAMVHTTSVSALYDLLSAAAGGNAAELVVELSYFEENQKEEVYRIVSQVQHEKQMNVQQPWEVYFYPEGGNAEIVEILLKK